MNLKVSNILALIKFAQETYSRDHFNTVLNSLWTEYKRDHKRRQEGTIHAWKACNLYTPIVLIFGPDNKINPEMLNTTDLLVKYQDLAILAASSVSDINDLVQLQKIVSAVPTFPNARSNSNNRVILVNEKHVQLLNDAIAFADANETDVVYPRLNIRNFLLATNL